MRLAQKVDYYVFLSESSRRITVEQIAIYTTLPTPAGPMTITPYLLMAKNVLSFFTARWKYLM